ncbi:MAG: hypothetical protein WCR45_09895 [Bacteroidaceae bacterium]|nr:hypothetical protein [Bacteroidaceae bacterium]
MNIEKTKRNLIGIFTLCVLVTGVLGAIILRFGIMNFFEGYYLIPVYFYFIGLLTIFLFDKFRRKSQKKLSMLYLAVKTVKFLISVSFMILFAFVFKENVGVFLVTFGLFYFLYLILETWFFFDYEVNLKRQIKNENEEVS